MHSQYSSNVRLMEQTLSNARAMSDHNNNNNNGRNNHFLPTIQENVVMEGTFQFLEDMELILAERKSNINTTTVLTEEIPKSTRAIRDLRALMLGNRNRLQSNEEPTEPTLPMEQRMPALRRRLETYLEEEMARAFQNEIESNQEPIELLSNANTQLQVGKTSKDKKKIRKSKKAEKNGEDEGLPIVWIIEPGYFKDHTLRFKFRTDGGACLILKDAEALETVEIMKQSSENIFFQVYTIQGGVSRIVKPDKINEIIEELLAEARPSVEEEDMFTAGEQEAQTRVKSGPGGRLLRYVMRRRWKNLVRRQVSIAAGSRGLHGRARGIWTALFPLLMIWKMMRRTRTF